MFKFKFKLQLALPLALGIGVAITQLSPAFGIVIKWDKLNELFDPEALNNILTENGVDVSQLTQVLQAINSPESIGLNDPQNTIQTLPVKILGSDGGVDWSAILNDPNFSLNTWKIADGSIKLGATNDTVPVGVDYVRLSQFWQAANQAVANNSERNQINNQATASIFQNAATTYSDVTGTPPNSTLEALEQSNKIAIANGMVQITQTKHIQSLTRSLEVANAWEINSANERRVDLLKGDMYEDFVDYNENLSRALSRR